MSVGLKSLGGGQVALSGELDFSGVATLWPQLSQLIGSEPLEVSLEGVTGANSAALALLLEARQLADERGVRLQFRGIQQDLKDLAGLSNALSLIES